MDSDRFDGLVRSFGQTRSRRGLGRLLGGLSLGGVLTTLGIPAVAAAGLNGGAKCTAGNDCKTGKCTKSGKCSCSAEFPRCVPPSNPCKKAACNTGRNRCETTNKKNGLTCGEGKTCQDGTCKTDEPDNRTVSVSFDSFDQFHTHCYVTVHATDFAPGTYPGSASFEEFTVEVGADGTGSWSSTSINLIWQVGHSVTAKVGGVSSGEVPVTC